MHKNTYPTLTTRRIEIGCQPLMATSQSPLKVKTCTLSSEEWQEDDGDMLATSITTTLE